MFFYKIKIDNKIGLLLIIYFIDQTIMNLNLKLHAKPINKEISLIGK